METRECSICLAHYLVGDGWHGLCRACAATWEPGEFGGDTPDDAPEAPYSELTTQTTRSPSHH